MVPEFTVDQRFELTANRPLEAFLEAKALGIHTRPVILGPLTFLKLGKSAQDDVSPISLIDRPLPVYARLLSELAEAGADWMQIDEPCLVLDLSDAERAAFAQAYQAMTKAAFVAASRRSRTITVLASYRRTDFKHPIPVGSIIDVVAEIVQTGRSSMTVAVELWSETLLEGNRQLTARGEFVMVSVGPDGRPVAQARG